jgi:hypothetical protein
MSQRKKMNVEPSQEIFAWLTNRLAVGPRIVDPREIRQPKPHLAEEKEGRLLLVESSQIKRFPIPSAIAPTLMTPLPHVEPFTSLRRRFSLRLERRVKPWTPLDGLLTPGPPTT